MHETESSGKAYTGKTTGKAKQKVEGCMKIWGDIPKISGVYGKQKGVGKVERASGVTAKKDVVSISSQAKDFQTAIKKLKEVPDIRPEKVNSLMEQYQSGNYQVNGKDIADSILRSTIDKKV